MGPYFVTTHLNPIQIHFKPWLDGRIFQQLARPNQPVWRAGKFHKGNLVFSFVRALRVFVEKKNVFC